MNTIHRFILATAILASAACRDVTEPRAAADAAHPAIASTAAPSRVATMYAADFVATAARGVDMNDAGDVVGLSRLDPGCGPFCLPPEDPVVWRGGTRIVLPPLAGFTWPGVAPQFINGQGWVAGIVGSPYSNTRAVVWRPSGGTYSITDLGALPGMSLTQVGGIDDLGRIVGWANDAPVFPTVAAPFMWTDAGGMVDLAKQGYPNDVPLAVSPNGRVATYNFHYQLGTPASALAMPTPPLGFSYGGYGTAINDAGDQARLLVSTGAQNLVYLFRFNAAAATFQLISSLGTGQLTSSGVGSINSALDITASVRSTGVVAPGPTGSAQSLAGLLSPAYGGATSSFGGQMNAAGAILTRVMIGRSERVMRLVPIAPCAGNCARSSSVAVIAKFVQDRARPGSCTVDGKARNDFTAQVTVTDEFGAPLQGAQVTGRFLDDYWMDMRVSGSTSRKGVVQFHGSGRCGVGAIAFLVDNVVSGTRAFDRSTGIVTAYQIPQ